MTQASITTIGVDGFLVTFSDSLSEPANRAALAFRAAVDAAGWNGVEETSTSLVSAFVRFDRNRLNHKVLGRLLSDLLTSRDWLAIDLPPGRRVWRIPTVYGGDAGPQLSEAARAVGVSTAEAINELSSTRVRVQTIGFLPGMPYLGELPKRWDLPRLTTLNRGVPKGALCVAVRQMVLFPTPTQTGWRQIARTAFDLFHPEGAEPFVLRPGDEVLFEATEPETFETVRTRPKGGASWEPLP